MDDLGISNAVVDTGAFSFRGVTTADVSYFSGFWVWHMKKPRRNLVTIVFEISDLIVGLSLKIYLTLQKLRTTFPICEVKICFLLYNIFQHFFQYAVFMDHLKPRRKIAYWLLMFQHRITWLERWAIPGNMHSVTNCQYRIQFTICYLNDNISTPVCRSSSVIM